MKEYSLKEMKEMKELKANAYILRVSRSKLYCTALFKETFWIRYQAGVAPRKILKNLGYSMELFRQKQIDSLVQRIKKQGLFGHGRKSGLLSYKE